MLPSSTTYPAGSVEREILDRYRAKVRPAFSKAGFHFVDLLSVEAMRVIARDLSKAPPSRRDEKGNLVDTPPDTLWVQGPQGTWQNGFEPLVAALMAAEAEYLIAICAYTATRHDAPNARPVHT